MTTLVIPQKQNSSDVTQLESDVATLQAQMLTKEPLTSRVNAIYVGKHGADANNGLTPANAKLTFQAAINAASSGDVVVCLDNGSYTESLTFASGVDVFAPNATLINSGTTTHTLANDVNVTFGAVTIPASTTGFTLNSEQAVANLDIKNWTLTSDAIGVASLDRKISIRAVNIELATGSFVSETTDSEVYLEFSEISVTGAGTVISVTTNAQITMFGSYVKDGGAGTLFYSQDVEAFISAVISNVNVNTLSNIGAACITELVSSRMAGSLSESGAGSVSIMTDVLPDTSPQLGGDLDLNTKNISSLGALATDHSYEGTILNRAVGETVAFGQGLYFDWTAKEYMKADATDSAKMPVVGIALEGKDDGEICQILAKGWIRDDDYNFAGSIIYAGETGNGDFVTTAPADSGDQVQVCGMAYSADIMYFDPSPVLVEIA